ncbi:MAG: trigger factor family protein, partial [bacterium]|nr:trigger factor family protein [bacterium]
MPNINVENISKTKVKLTITVSKDEMKPFLEKAAQELSKDVKIPGFRPGKATYEQVEKRVGAMAILEAAMDDIVRKFYVQTAIEKKLDAVGPPNINVTKMAPDNDLEFEATVSTMPAVTKLADWKTLEVKQQTKEVTDKEVNQALDDLTNMQTKEVRAA